MPAIHLSSKHLRIRSRTAMGKGKKKSAQSDEPSEKESRCIWSQADESALITFISTHRAKGGDGMNFDKTCWVSAAAEMAAKGTPGVGAVKNPHACQQKWARIHKFFKLVDKIANSSGITYTCEKGANITAESETIWADLLKADPHVKSIKNAGWEHYEALLEFLPTQTSTWTGFHTSLDLNANTSTPTGSTSASDIVMMSLENLLENVKFRNSIDAEMMPAIPEDPQTASSTVPAQFAPPITPTSSRGAGEPPHFLAPSLGSTSTPASSTAVKRKTLDDDTSRHESCPPHSSKSGKSAGGSSKSQRVTMPAALEEFGGKVTTSIDTATVALQEAVTGRFVEPVPIRKQRAICQVQQEQHLDDHEVLKMIKVFQTNVAVADSYLNITRDGVRNLFLADYLDAN